VAGTLWLPRPGKPVTVADTGGQFIYPDVPHITCLVLDGIEFNFQEILVTRQIEYQGYGFCVA
jgi:hypothetical protein